MLFRTRFFPLFAVASLIVATGCAHEVLWLGEEPEVVQAPETPLPMTLAVAVRSFEAPGLEERGVVGRFVQELRQLGFFQAVMYPIPTGAEPLWEIELLVRGSGVEPDSNFWKAALAQFLLPLAFVIYLEDEYTLELEALLVRNRELVGSYATQGRIKHRYQLRASRLALRNEGAEMLLRNTTRAVLDALLHDLPRIERVNAS